MMNKKLFKKIILIGLLPLFLTSCLAGLGVATIASTKVATDPRTAGVQIDDEILEEKISYNINKYLNSLNDDEIKNNRINVIVYDKTVLLTGQVSSFEIQNKVKDESNIDGIKNIFNEIRVEPILSTSQSLIDSWITSQVKSKMLVSNQVKATDVKVFTENGEVFLMGKVTGNQAEVAVDIARNVKNVKKVIKAFNYISLNNSEDLTSHDSKRYYQSESSMSNFDNYPDANFKSSQTYPMPNIYP